MRTTLSLSERAYDIVTRYAAANRLSMGEAVSRLIEREFDAPPLLKSGPGTLKIVPATGRTLSSDQVRAIWSEE